MSAPPNPEIINPPGGLTYSGGFRVTPYPTVYGDFRTSWMFDMEIIGILAGWLAVTFSLFLILPTLRCRKHDCAMYWFMIFYLWIGGLLMLATYGHGWQESYVSTRVPYISNSNLYVDVTVGVQVGLRGVNVTMVGNPLIQANHTINYNERFWWGGEDVLLPLVTWGQGKEGYLGNGGQIFQEFKKNMERGVPWPILWVAEWFLMDGEYIRWGRYYRTAGYYTFQISWTAWCLWFLNMFLFFMVPIYGFYGLICTGVLMEVAILVYGGLLATVNARIGPLTIPFDRDVKMIPIFSWSFFFVLFGGIAAILVGIAGVVFLTATKKEEKITFADERNEAEMKEMPKQEPKTNNNASQPTTQQPPNAQYNYGAQQQQPQYNYGGAQTFDNQGGQPYVPPRPNYAVKQTNDVRFG